MNRPTTQTRDLRSTAAILWRCSGNRGIAMLEPPNRSRKLSTKPTCSKKRRSEPPTSPPPAKMPKTSRRSSSSAASAVERVRGSKTRPRFPSSTAR